MTDLSVHPHRWVQRQRYAFLEQRLYWEGGVSRADLVARFGISPPQASEDLANYQDLAPGALELDRVRKLYVPTELFVPQFFTPSARHYLTQLLLLSDEAIAEGDSWLGVIPAHSAMPRVRRRLDVETLRPIISAIHRRRAVEVIYQSMSSPEPSRRWFAPHALMYDGARWHARSWCFNRSTFVDFVLARILKVTDMQHSGVDAALDREWHEMFPMKLSPNPKLSEAQQRVVEMDYGMIDGEITISMRLCMTYYFERHYSLDLPTEQLPPSRMQVVLRNRDQLERTRDLFGARKEPA